MTTVREVEQVERSVIQGHEGDAPIQPAPQALERAAALRDGIFVDHAVARVRAIASVDAWHFLVHERRWKQDRAAERIVKAIDAALLRGSPPKS